MVFYTYWFSIETARELSGGGLGPEELEIYTISQMYPHLKYILTLHSTI
jgi:hypothetical protein